MLKGKLARVGSNPTQFELSLLKRLNSNIPAFLSLFSQSVSLVPVQRKLQDLPDLPPRLKCIPGALWQTHNNRSSALTRVPVSTQCAVDASLLPFSYSTLINLLGKQNVEINVQPWTNLTVKIP